jgi:hypothetical protein
VITVGQRVAITEADGPISVRRYGTVSSLIPGQVIVQFDGEVGGRPVTPDRCRAVEIDTVIVEWTGPSSLDLLDDVVLRPRLVDMWLAEAADAGLLVDGVHRLADGLHEGGDAVALAEVVADGRSWVLGARLAVGTATLTVSARRPNRWDF